MRLIWILLPGLLMAQPSRVRVLWTTPTQASVAGIPVCGTSMSIQLSTSNTYSPLALDVDPAYFTGADNSLTRTTTIVHNQEQQVVFGLRGHAYLDNSGVLRSRALQQGTKYYGKFTDCGGNTTFTFTTQAGKFGSSWPEPFPADPSNPGGYLWPVVTTPTGYASNNESVVDPQTGVLVNRATGSREIAPNPNTAAGLSKYAWVSDDARWSIGVNAVFTANGSGPNPKLFIPMDIGSFSSTFASQSQAVNIFDYIQSLHTVSGAPNGQINLCLTKDGVNCATNGNTLTQATTGSPTPVTVGGTLAYMASWFGGRVPTVTTPDIYRSTTTATNTAGVLTRTAGDYFSANLVVGSSVWLGATRCLVTANNGPYSITVSSPPANGSYSVVQPTFGVLLWQTSTANTDSTTITASSFNAGWSYGISNYLNGAYMDWNSPITSGGYRSWMIVNGSNQAFTGFLNPSTAAMALLGWAGYPFNTSGFSNGSAQTFSGNFGAAYDPSDPTSFYGLGRDGSNNIVVAKIQSTSNTQRSFPIILGSITAGYQSGQVATNYSPAPYNLLPLINAFNPLFDVSVNTTCTLDGIQGRYIIGRCGPGSQDNMPGAWTWVWDTSLGPSSISNNPVVGTLFSDGSGCRYCVLHGIVQAGSTTWVDSSNNCAGGTGTCRSNGTFTAPLFTGTFDARFGSHLANSQSPSDTTITLSTQPTATNVAIGDVFQIGTGASSELEKITGGSFPTFNVSRGYNQGATGSAHSAGDNAMGICTPYGESAGDALWWDFSSDPLGTGALGTTIQVDTTIPGGHRMYRPTRYVEQNGSLDCTAATQVGSCTAVRDGSPPSMFGTPINFFISNYSYFAGIQPQPGGGLHPHMLQADHSFSTDVMLPNPYTNHTVALVAGKTYIYKVTITLHRKQQPTWVFSGDKNLLDISAPSSVLNDTTADNWKYCVAAATNECITGSAVGDIYANVPPLSVTGCNTSTDTDSNGNFTRDLCVNEFNAWWTGGVTQKTLGATDQFSVNMRRLTAMGMRYHRQGPNFASPGSVSPGSELFSYVCQWCDGVRGDYMTAILPPLPTADSQQRSTFCPNCLMSLKGPSGTSTAWVKFGYLEFGTAAQAYCSSRIESCIANSTTIDQTNAFKYITVDSPSKVSCASGCVIAVPVLPDHVAYAYPEYFNGGGIKIGGGTSEMVTVPAP